MKYDTINDAAHGWVREFNAIPQEMISKLMSLDIDDWHEVTTPAYGDRVYVYDSGKCGEIEKLKTKEGETLYGIKLDGATRLTWETIDDFEVERYDGLPMWGTMWSFGDGADNYWLSDLDGIKQMSECGFRIFESEEFGYFFGIDGAGYDFYDAHWIPLYKARGLHWHKEEE